MIKKFGFWFAIFLFVLALASIGIYIQKKLSEPNPDNIIIQTSDLFKPNLKSFLDIVGKTVDDISSKASYLDVDNLPKDSLNAFFSKLINGKEYLHGIVLLGQDIDYALVRDKNSWLMTHSLKNEFVDWFRLNEKLKVVSEWTDANNVIMDTNNLRSLKASVLSNEKSIWLSAESEIAEKRDVLFNIFKIENAGETDVVGLIYRTSQLGQHFNEALKFDSPLVTLITTKNLVTPMRTKDPDEYDSLKKLSVDVNKIIDKWQKMPQPESKLFTMESIKNNYWLRIDTIAPQSGVRAYALAISQKDLFKSINKFEQVFGYAAIMFFLFSLAAFLAVYRKMKKQNSPVNELKELSQEEIQSLIQKGETEFVEFKSSLRWDYNLQKVNKILELVILKTIAAFTNASGGTLIIGVDDDFNILGLEPDFNSFTKKNVDYFELHLRKQINNQFGVRFSNNFILTRFPVIQGRTICVLQVAPADQPQFLKLKNKQGSAEEKFYVRSGNASQQITSLTKINEYIEGHFSKENT